MLFTSIYDLFSNILHLYLQKKLNSIISLLTYLNLEKYVLLRIMLDLHIQQFSNDT